ncbi:MAG: gas vesicle protein GvpN [Planctomycetes bacterium]|nr:gas vesicle protein GvpN [Planctomycetota bacterium]
MTQELTTLIEPRPVEGFVETPYIRDLVERAMGYLAAGFPLHLRGISGTGKTTVAMHIASKINRPVVLIHGDDELTTSDLVGGAQGFKVRKVVDNFIHSVRRSEEDYFKRWVDNRLTVACKYGFTLIYDEFTRARPETNNILLSVLQERMLDLPTARDGQHYIRVSPDFCAIFSSNPEEYAGVHKTQDALRDRMVTLDLEHFDEVTECAIAASRSGTTPEEIAPIVQIIRAFRQEKDMYDFAPTVRAGIMIAKTARVRGARVCSDDPIFRQICFDVLGSETSRLGTRSVRMETTKIIGSLIDRYCQTAGNVSSRGKTCKAKSSAPTKELALAGVPD